MSDGRPTRDELENLRAAYDQICTNVRTVDDFRAKLLGLLPLASGAGIFLLLGQALGADGESITRQFLLPVGAFGFAVTMGLYLYELRGIQYCTHLIAAGWALEERLEVNGRFRTRPKLPDGCVNEIWAAHIVYAAVLAGWAFVMAVFPAGSSAATPAVRSASLIAIVGFLIVIAAGSKVRFGPDPRAKPEGREDTSRIVGGT